MNDASGMEIHVSCVYSQIVGMMMMSAKTFLLNNEIYTNFIEIFCFLLYLLLFFCICKYQYFYMLYILKIKEMYVLFMA